MLTKIKRIRRKKYAVGDEVRDFKNIPKASQPQQQTIGDTTNYLDKYVNKQVTNPNVAAKSEQSYTSQAVQSNELLSGSTLTSPTAIGANSITKKLGHSCRIYKAKSLGTLQLTRRWPTYSGMIN